MYTAQRLRMEITPRVLHFSAFHSTIHHTSTATIMSLCYFLVSPLYFLARVSVLFGRSSTETFGWRVGRHTHSFPTIVHLLTPGSRRTVSQQLLLGLLQHCTVGIVLLKQLNTRLCVRGWIMLVANKSCSKDVDKILYTCTLRKRAPPLSYLYLVPYLDEGEC